MESTSTAGTFAVNTGNTLYGTPSEKAANPKEVKPYKAQQYVPSYAITEAASCNNDLSDDDLKKFYPPEALQLQIEQQVQVRVTIDDDGSVVKVEVLKDPGHGFAEAAKKVARSFHCKPGKQNGKPVATEITSTLNFELPN
jgi:protein TonB